MPSTMNVSVILPTYNRLPRLKQVLQALAEQDYPAANFEVVVVSDGSSDGTEEYLRQLQRELQMPFTLRPFFQANQGVAAARNNGIQQAAGDLILFIDDDVVPAANLISEHLRSHQQYGDQVVVLGPMLTPPAFEPQMAPWVQWEQAMLTKQYEDMAAGRWLPTARQFYTGNTSIARRHLVAAGGFDPTFRRAEDVELAYRLAANGLRFVFNPAAIGHHYAERSFQSWLAIPYAYGRNDVIFSRDKGQQWLLPTILYEFRERRRLIRALTRLCLDRPLLTRLTIAALKQLAVSSKQLADTAHRSLLTAHSLPRMAYSAIFNLRHYQGIADEMGGRAAFFAAIAQTTTRQYRAPGRLEIEQIPNPKSQISTAADPIQNPKSKIQNSIAALPIGGNSDV